MVPRGRDPMSLDPEEKVLKAFRKGRPGPKRAPALRAYTTSPIALPARSCPSDILCRQQVSPAIGIPTECRRDPRTQLESLDGLHELGGFRLAVAVEHARVIEIEQRVLDP